MTRPSREARDAIEDLIADNVWALDTHDLDRYVATYWDDGEWIDLHPDGSEIRLVGADAIREGTAAYFAARSDHQHRLQTPLYLETETGWTVWMYYWSLQRDPRSGSIETQTAGWIRDEVEARAGEWRLRRRTVGQWDGTLPHPLAGP